MPFVSDVGSAAHPDPELTDLFRGIRRDARNQPQTPAPVHTAGIDLCFDGGSLGGVPQALVAGITGTPLEIPFDCRLLDVRVYADQVCTATIDVQYGTFAQFPSSLPLYDTAGMPGLGNAQTADISVSSWQRKLARRDILQFKLATFSGTATKITLALWVRKVDGASGSANVADSTGLTLVDSNGNVIAQR